MLRSSNASSFSCTLTPQLVDEVLAWSVNVDAELAGARFWGNQATHRRLRAAERGEESEDYYPADVVVLGVSKKDLIPSMAKKRIAVPPTEFDCPPSEATSVVDPKLARQAAREKMQVSKKAKEMAILRKSSSHFSESDVVEKSLLKKEQRRCKDVVPAAPAAASRTMAQVDIGQGLQIPMGEWKRIQLQPKDSLFVKELVVVIWDTADLKGRYLQALPMTATKFSNEPFSAARICDRGRGGTNNEVTCAPATSQARRLPERRTPE
ncbi:hypothetical protein HPB49_004898 [Dermacentor silvarum]|uniref:Uncharacterized protein n=1 Tax=Dermacentor silvarum TaxID=543639 RepID=A0ACB8C259_DERSI|nr:hypothetical protein HPB49_004898 [Dermacentor silvarum]